jgi:simple sugar transport system permease protein
VTPDPPETDHTPIEETAPARNTVFQHKTSAQEPSPRRFAAFLAAAVYPLAALSLALLLCAAVVALAGQNPLTAGSTLMRGALGSPERIAESLAKTIPLLMTGLSVTIAFRAGFFNVGAEGQLLMGALAAAGLGAKLQLPIPFVLLGGAVAGAAWALIAGVLKTRRGAPEIITTIMLNYIALQLVAFSLQMPDREGAPHGWLLERAQTQPQSDVLAERSQLPPLLADTNLHAGLLIALLCAVACWWFLFRTERGFLVRASGANALAARAAGIAVEKETLRAVALCGALSGWAARWKLPVRPSSFRWVVSDTVTRRLPSRCWAISIHWALFRLRSCSACWTRAASRWSASPMCRLLPCSSSLAW